MAQNAYPPSWESSYSHSRSGGPPSYPVLPEQMIGSYVIRETIGRGSFGKVKKGRHVHTGEYVAIKILNRQKLKSANMDRKIHREIEILQLFSHPNICRLYEVISTPTDMYLIMEYVEGGELYDYIVQKGRVRESEARYIFQQIVCAIEYCHHFRVVHRDLKPENILLGTGLQVKLIDFGLSNITKDGEFLATSCGSPNYAAPEVISGKLYFGPEVDVWSCGVILYALLCGCLPFDEDSIPLLFSKIKKGKYAMPSNMQAGPRELIQQILVVDPLVRLTVPQIRDNAWFNQRLPMRLSYSESIFSVKEDRILSVLVSETAKRLGVRDRDVRKELEHGSGAAYVAYNILLDARRRREIAAEVRELGMSGDESRGISHAIGTQQTKFQPKAMERELNMGLMLTQSPAMVVLLDEDDATRNKWAYNRGFFVPASTATFGDTKVSDTSLSDVSGNGGPGGPPAVGSFRITSKVCTGSLIGSGSAGSSLHAPGSLRGAAGLTGGGSSHRRTGMLSGTGGTAASQLGVSLSDQPRVGSVARKHAMYTAEEEQFIVENNYGWRIGIMTDWRAEKSLSAIYDVLRSFGMQWKVVSPFRLLARSTAETWSVVADSTQSPKASTWQNTLNSYSIESSAPIRIGSRSGAPASGSSDDHEGDDVAGSMLRDEESIHLQVAHTRRPGAAGRSLVSAPGGGFHTNTSQVARGNYFGNLQGGDEEAAMVAGRTTTSILPSVHVTESESASPSSPFNPRDASSLASTSTSAVAETITPPLNPVVLSLYFFRIHERHDKGYLVDFKVMRNAMVGADLVLLLSDALVRKLG
ncbi:5'-AMP-activated protein kinase catalytic subunit alpha, putative [Leishmania guyanensis]|uniref:Serine/threonine protein kinase, putative,protein kinase, putative n=1 Tax=Leishmania guyanensis TaxID=5670 RepID=A0A1E1J1B9_LEIGU|nr:serine/threonine protein kinase, putative,protein kinase, putative [Leishmania guyanensis]